MASYRYGQNFSSSNFFSFTFWAEALSTGVHLINQLSSPHFQLHGHHPQDDHLHTFGCFCFVHIPPPEHIKFSAQSAHYAFLGYAPIKKGFLSYDTSVHHIRTSCNAVSASFFSNIQPLLLQLRFLASWFPGLFLYQLSTGLNQVLFISGNNIMLINTPPKNLPMILILLSYSTGLLTSHVPQIIMVFLTSHC